MTPLVSPPNADDAWDDASSDAPDDVAGSPDYPDTNATDSSSTLTSALWAPPADFTDLASFGIKKFGYGEQNLALVVGALPIAAPLVSSLVEGEDDKGASWSSPTGTMLQLRYPQGSINPGNNPQGGADFYSVPQNLALPLEQASNVTLEYSVYFPADFAWALGGKLPGLYGGHEGCSGGDSAQTCFSTRMMWRTAGAGELYLVRRRLPSQDDPSNRIIP